MTLNQSSTSKRIFSLGYIISFLLLLLITRLFFIQTINGYSLAQKALTQRKATISIERIRGDILDRNGISFTRGKEDSFIILFPGMVSRDNEMIPLIKYMTCLTEEELAAILNSNKTFFKKRILNPNPNAELDIEDGKCPGAMILRQRNRYDQYSLARHLIGYVQSSDNQPVMGIEKEYQQYLNTNTSKIIYAVKDAKNRVIPGFGFKIIGSPQPNYNIKLTLDYYIQKILEDVLDAYPGRQGGIVVDAKSGEILALASRPNYDQNNASDSLEREDVLLPVPLNAFHPGSVFKIVIGAAALESKQFTEDAAFKCEGGITVSGGYYSCHSYPEGFGYLTLREAFARSCNDTFIKIAASIGGKKIIQLAYKFGLGQSIDIGFHNECGRLPMRDHYIGPGIGNLALGQDMVETTPLQIADLITTIVNNGNRKKLSLIKSITSDSGETIAFDNNKDIEQVITSNTANTLMNWMIDVTEYGTGKSAKIPEIGGIAGKTGTAQISGDLHSKHYGWFASFFPQREPKYIIVIMSREEGNASETAVPLVKEIARNIWEYDNNMVNVN